MNNIKYFENFINEGWFDNITDKTHKTPHSVLGISDDDVDNLDDVSFMKLLKKKRIEATKKFKAKADAGDNDAKQKLQDINNSHDELSTNRFSWKTIFKKKHTSSSNSGNYNSGSSSSSSNYGKNTYSSGFEDWFNDFKNRQNDYKNDYSYQRTKYKYKGKTYDNYSDATSARDRDETKQSLIATGITVGAVGAAVGVGAIINHKKKKIIKEIILLKYGKISEKEYEGKESYYVSTYSLSELKKMRDDLKAKKKKK